LPEGREFKGSITRAELVPAIAWISVKIAEFEAIPVEDLVVVVTTTVEGAWVEVEVEVGVEVEVI